MTKDLFGIGCDILFSKLYKTMMNKVTFSGLKGGDHPNRHPGSATALRHQILLQY